MKDLRDEIEKMFEFLTAEVVALKPEQPTTKPSGTAPTPPTQRDRAITFDVSGLTEYEKQLFSNLLKKVKITVKKR